jgi:SAM-dependent methyltransferase
MGNQTIRNRLFSRIYPGISARARNAGRVRMPARGPERQGDRGGCRARDQFLLYPATVTRVLAVEPEEHLLELAKDAAPGADSDRGRPEWPRTYPPRTDPSTPAVVSLVLCTVRDPDRALAEPRRVLRPGGELRFYEHVIAHNRFGARLQRLADATVWPTMARGVT